MEVRQLKRTCLDISFSFALFGLDFAGSIERESLRYSHDGLNDERVSIMTLSITEICVIRMNGRVVGRLTVKASNSITPAMVAS